ncbi:MAG: phosphopentomutase [Oscillospiraceae bacterium]|nr:phosphopentomutase [Oscillospiraceae bacterium]
MSKRVFLIVLDSFGIGEMPDSAEYGDAGSNTLAACAKAGVNLPNMVEMGLGNITGVSCLPKCDAPTGAFARVTERSKGKDTTIGHWEIAGVVSPRPMPTFPDGFPADFIERFEKAVGRKTLCNKPYSGTDVIRDFGEEHLATGALIVYTSADSVFQIAAHEEKVPLEELYSICEKARELLCDDLAVGRVIARPFIGEHPFIRSAGRHDYSLEPTGTTVLDRLKDAGLDVIGVGKISDIFAGRGITESFPDKGNDACMARTMELCDRDFHGLCFVNLVDFDMVYGHRRDSEGYGKAICEFDSWLGKFLPKLGDDDALIITADHGCDPGYTESTDHTREYVPYLCYNKNLNGQNIGTKPSFTFVADEVLRLLETE